MSYPTRHPARAVCLVLATTMLLPGCTLIKRLSSVGTEPPLTSIQNPVQHPDYRRVSMPMPNPRPIERHRNSLWRAGARAFFKDQRAGRVGDILTVLISIDDKAEISNKSTRSRDNEESAAANALLGYEASLAKVLPEAIQASNLLDIESGRSNSGEGTVNRDESIELKVAAVVTQRLPNGNLVLHGRQEVRVNFEVRELQIAGVIRPEDITSENNISYEKIAEARISYGGRGQISDMQQPPYGYQLIDVLFPF